MTVDEALQIQLDEKAKHPELSELDSNSRVSIWRLMFYVSAQLASWLSLFFENQKTEIEASFQYVPFGTARWYRQKALEFQSGDLLEFDPVNFTFKYAALNTEKQLIKQCAVVADGGEVTFKLATGTIGNLTPVPATVADEFRAYINEIKYAGTPISIINQEADKVKMNIVVYYDAERDPEEISSDLKTAASSYLNTMNSTSFGGIFSSTQLVDAIQTVRGVTDVVINDASGKSANGSQWIPFDSGGRYQSYAGYVVYDNINNLFTPHPNDQ